MPISTTTISTLAALKQKVAVTSSKKTAEKYDDSFGESLYDLKGRSRWALAGLASEIWEQQLRVRIDELLQINDGAIYKRRAVRATPIPPRCWMLGYSRNCALPTVVICCADSTILRRSMRVILKHELLKPEGFDLKGMAPCDLCHYAGDASNTQWPHLQPHVRAATFQRPSSQSIPLRAPALQADAAPEALGQNVCGFGLVAGPSNKRATLGGALIIGEDFFGLTSAHVLDDASPSKDPGKPDDAQMYDSAWAEQESDESDEDIEDIIAQSAPPTQQLTLASRVVMPDEDSHLTIGKSIHTPQSEYYWSPYRLYILELSSLADFEPTDNKRGSLPLSAQRQVFYWEHKSDLENLDVVAMSACCIRPVNSKDPAPNLDWALLQLADTTRYKNIIIRPGTATMKASTLEVKGISKGPPTGEVLVNTRRGVVRAKGSGSSCSLQLPRNKTAVKVWSIDLESHLGSSRSHRICMDVC